MDIHVHVGHSGILTHAVAQLCTNTTVPYLSCLRHISHSFRLHLQHLGSMSVDCKNAVTNACFLPLHDLVIRLLSLFRPWLFVTWNKNSGRRLCLYKIEFQPAYSPTPFSSFYAYIWTKTTFSLLVTYIAYTHMYMYCILR